MKIICGVFVLINLKNSECKGLLTVIYHSPSTSDAAFLRYLEEILETVINLEKMNIVIGDFNIDVSKNSYYSSALIRLIEDSGLTQKVNFYTRITETSKTIIDLDLTNVNNITVNPILKSKVSDHETLSIKICDKTKTNCDIYKNIISWKHYTKETLCSLLTYINWSPFFVLDINNKLNFLCNTLSNVVNNLLVYKKIKIKIKKKCVVYQKLKKNFNKKK